VTHAEDAVAAIRAGEVVVVPTDTVYGLACTPYRAEPVQRLSALKGRSSEQPVALVATSVDWLLECVPELRARSLVAVRALLPGPFTLVLANPARRFPWLTGSRPETIGVRVPDVVGTVAGVLREVGAVAATSANLHGGVDPRRVQDVPPEIRDEVAVVVDAGELSGTPSTVLDLTGDEPLVLREGAVPAAEALARVTAALAE
jgi:L-threonylcarbamoyladenylate synthase